MSQLIPTSAHHLHGSASLPSREEMTEHINELNRLSNLHDKAGLDSYLSLLSSQLTPGSLTHVKTYLKEIWTDTNPTQPIAH